MLRIIQAWRDSNRPIFHVRHDSTTPESPLAPSHAGNAHKAGFEPQEGEPLITKNVNSAFIGTDLEEQLRTQNITHVVIIGLTTNHCVSTTTRMSGNFGFVTFLASDAVATFDREGYDGTMYDAETVHNLALASLHNEFATVLPTDELLAML